MPRYTLKSVTEADRRYANLPEATRRLADRRIQELLENPTGNPDKQYDPQFDQWSIPIGSDKGWIVYAIVENARLVILLRSFPASTSQQGISVLLAENGPKRVSRRVGALVLLTVVDRC